MPRVTLPPESLLPLGLALLFYTQRVTLTLTPSHVRDGSGQPLHVALRLRQLRPERLDLLLRGHPSAASPKIASCTIETANPQIQDDPLT